MAFSSPRISRDREIPESLRETTGFSPRKYKDFRAKTIFFTYNVWVFVWFSFGINKILPIWLPSRQGGGKHFWLGAQPPLNPPPPKILKRWSQSHFQKRSPYKATPQKELWGLKWPVRSPGWGVADVAVFSSQSSKSMILCLQTNQHVFFYKDWTKGTR